MRVRKNRLKKERMRLPVDAVVLQPEWQKEEYVARVLPPRDFPPEPRWDETPFSPPEPGDAYAALRDFYAEQPRSTWLSPLTGLPAYLYGDLQAPPQGRNADAAIKFLKEHELILTGLSRGTNLSRVSESVWHDDGAYQVTFVQTNKEGVPFYGGGVTCNTLPDRLTFVTSTLHPARANAIDDLAWPLTWAEWKRKMVPIASPDDSEYLIRPQAFTPPPDLREESRQHRWRADRWILPYLPRGAREGVYRPVWRTIIVDQENESWLALIDARDMQVLHIETTRIEESLTVPLYANAPNALSGTLTSKSLNYGAGNTSMKDANGVHFVDPPVNQGNSRFVEPDGTNTPLMALSATVFYHLRRAQQSFPGIAWFTSSSSESNVSKPFEDIDVSLSNEPGSACYKIDDKQIILYTGTANTSPPTPVLEPGFDCEVIYHEFAHAMNRYYNPMPFKPLKSRTRELDEGLAFYFACVLGGNEQWAEYAYQHWVNIRNLVNGPTTPQQAIQTVNSDPTGRSDQTVGLWWGRVFWAIAQTIDETWCNYLLIKAFKSLSGPPETREVFAEALVAYAGEHTEKVEAILNTFGALTT